MTPTQLLTAAELDTGQLRRLAQLEDEAGILTITVGHDPSRPEESRAAEAAVRSGLAEWRKRDDRDFVDRLNARVEELDDELEALVDPATHGRGRVLITSLAEGADVHVVRLQQPLDPHVVIARHAWLRPLIAFWARMQPVRVIGVHHGGVRVFDWTLGHVTHQWDREVEFGDQHLADVKSGPSSPESPQRGSVNRERFEDRLDANRERMLRQSVADAVETGRDAGWTRFLVTGPNKLHGPVLKAIDTDHVEVWTDDHDITGMDEEGVRELVQRHADLAFGDRERHLVDRIENEVGAGAKGVVGMAGVLSALNEGRVETLVVATREQPAGYLLPDGRLTLHEHEDGSEPEPFLLDRVMATALLTDADVVPIGEEHGPRLEEGVGAILRW